MICISCGYVGRPKHVTRGSCLIELLLWSLFILGLILVAAFSVLAMFFLPFFILPGLIYSVWRWTNRYDVCPRCKHASMIPLDTPVGRKMMASELRENEEILAEVDATYKFEEGQMKITNRRVLFESPSTSVEISLESVAEVLRAESRGIIGSLPNAILIKTRSGIKYQFAVDDREKLINLIQDNTPSTD